MKQSPYLIRCRRQVLFAFAALQCALRLTGCTEGNNPPPGAGTAPVAPTPSTAAAPASTPNDIVLMDAPAGQQPSVAPTAPGETASAAAGHQEDASGLDSARESDAGSTDLVRPSVEDELLRDGMRLFPADGATLVNPDTHLKITFGSPPEPGTRGELRVYEVGSEQLVDTLDLSIPFGPDPSLTVSRREAMERLASGLPEPTYQELTIDGLQGFHFHPLLVRKNTATFDLHTGVLEYGKTYRVEVDPDVLVHDDFTGVSDVNSWTFSTKPAPPPADATMYTVAASGDGDFNTIQGAVEFVPDSPKERVTLWIKSGSYEELVFFRDKSNLTLRGEERESTVVGYPNNSSFNPGRDGISYRPAFSALGVTDVQLSNFTINNYFIGQAEALKLSGKRNIIERMTLNGSGDALTLRGTIYMLESTLRGDGDSILSYGAAYFERSEFRTIGPLQWIRNPASNHGHVFKDCTIIGLDEPLPWSVTSDNPAGQKTPAVFARLPENNGTNYPYAEFVLLNTTVDGIVPEGVTSVESQTTFSWANVHFWEYNTLDANGEPLDLAQRHPIMRELKQPGDAALIEAYSDPAHILDGWVPEIHEE